LIELADRDRPGGQADWADVFAAVSVRDVYEVEIELRWPHARPEALLRTPMQRAGLLSAPGAEELGIVAESIAPYGVHERTTTETRYVAQRPYFAATPKQPLEVVERQFATSKDAVRALRGGEIQVLDRIDPWDIDSLRTEKEIVVEPYDLPTVHCLLVNTRNLFLGNRSFRRALAYGMNRELILERQVLKRKLVPGCRLMSGPFAAGEEDVFDPQRYAYDHNVLPRKYDPAVAVALTNVALSAVGKAKGQEFEAAPTLKLAYPADEIARSACEAIQRHLEVVKIPIELVPLPRGQAPEPNEAYDLVYAAVVVQEPLTDARRLLGTDGVAGACAPYMTLALRSLDDAVGWNEVRDNLNRIHRLAFDDNVVIPLWQITEHFPYHQSVQGIGSRPALLYENIEQWQCSFQPTGAAP
jgi:ABC-type transport system substrate-binding protein